MGSTTVTPAPPPVSQHVSVTKTGNGEFIMRGDLRTLIEYFEQAPEIWLRLMALKGDSNAD